MSDCSIIACFDAQLLLRVDLECGHDVAGVHGHDKLHVASGSCSTGTVSMLRVTSYHTKNY